LKKIFCKHTYTKKNIHAPDHHQKNSGTFSEPEKKDVVQREKKNNITHRHVPRKFFLVHEKG